MWLSDSIINSEILPSNYTIYHKDRSTRGSGFLIALDESILSSMIPTPSNLEVITVRIDVGQHINVCKVYVPPNAWYDCQVSLLMYFNVLHLWMCPHCCDYNLPDISLSSFTDTSLFSNYTYNWSKSHAHVNSPTHLKGNLLDLVLINADIIQDLMVNPPPYSLASDHYTLTFSMKFGKQETLKTSSHYVQRLTWIA